MQQRGRPTSKLVWALGATLALTAVFPLIVSNSYQLYVMSLAYVMVVSAAGLNLIFGYTGQLNLGHAAYYTVGAYTVGILTADHQVPYWLAFIAGGVITGVLGFAGGLLSLRLKSHYFSIFTLCIGVIIYLLIEKSSFTHGTVGIIDIPPPGPIGPVTFESPISQYYLALAFMIVALWVMHRITRSLLGRAFIAVRNSEELAEAVGVNLMRTKTLAFVISTVYAGLAGGIYAGLARFLDPSMALPAPNFQLLAYVLIGGAGTLLGPVVGVLVMTWVMQLLGPFQDYGLLFYGLLLIILVTYFPRGFMGLAGGLARAWPRRIATHA
jgi:branched-chain amino acid transport system permease protein